MSCGILINKGKWILEEDINVMWSEMVGCIKRVDEEVLVEFRGKAQIKELVGGMVKFKQPLELRGLVIRIDRILET